MSYKIVEVKFLGTNDKVYFFTTKLNLEKDKWYNIYTKESSGYSSPIKVVKEYSTTFLYNVTVHKEIIAAKEVYLYEKIDETKHSTDINSNSPKDGFINQVWFNPVKGTTVVRWIDGSKTMVRCQGGEPFDKEKGLALCYMKRTLGNKGSFNEVLKHWCHTENPNHIVKKEKKVKTSNNLIEKEVKEYLNKNLSK